MELPRETPEAASLAVSDWSRTSKHHLRSNTDSILGRRGTSRSPKYETTEERHNSPPPPPWCQCYVVTEATTCGLMLDPLRNCMDPNVRSFRNANRTHQYRILGDRPTCSFGMMKYQRSGSKITSLRYTETRTSNKIFLGGILRECDTYRQVVRSLRGEERTRPVLILTLEECRNSVTP